MNRSQTIERVRMVADEIPGYDYGSPSTAKSPITLQEFEALKQSATFTKEDEHWLRVAGETLADQTKELVGKWRDIIAKHPHLARQIRHASADFERAASAVEPIDLRRPGRRPQIAEQEPQQPWSRPVHHRRSIRLQARD